MAHVLSRPGSFTLRPLWSQLMSLLHAAASLFQRSEPDWESMTRDQKAEQLARLMGYKSYNECRKDVDDVLALEE